VSVAVVTGCSTGIGFATAAALARLGHEVFAAMRNPSGAPELAQLATAEKLPITVIRMDVDSDESVRSSFQTVCRKGKDRCSGEQRGHSSWWSGGRTGN
jgi:NAD(P)-dependent dehydrogenase (short-subunit alcohol dehydrogenase family)